MSHRLNGSARALDACALPRRRSGTIRRALSGATAVLATIAFAFASLGASCTTLLPIEVRDTATGQPIPAKILVYSASTGAPVNLGTGTGGTLVSWFQNRMYMGQGTGSIDLPAGVYDIWATRGLEWTAAHQTVDTNNPTGILFTLSRAVTTPGYVSADFHIHARPSFESALQNPKLPELPDRVVQYLTEGVEIMGSADHDCVVDYAPVITSLGLSNQISSLVGVEATPGTNSYPDGNGNCDLLGPGSPPGSAEPGHWNAFPVAPNAFYDTEADTGTALNPVAAATMYDMMRGLGDSNTLIQLNHPYFETGTANIGWFDKSNFNPSVPIPAAWTGNSIPTNSFLRKPSTAPGSTTQGLDFDAFEMWAGGSVVQGRPTRAAWISLLNQGFLKIATANGDSHNSNRSSGYPRNLVYVGTDDPTAVTPNQLAAAVKAGKVVGTTGPIPTIAVNGVGMGGMVADGDGSVDVAIAVQAAPWVPVEEIRILVNGVTAQTISLTAQNPEPALRYSDTVSIAVTKDSWIAIEAGAQLPSNPNQEPPVPYEYSKVTAGMPSAQGNTGFTPLSFTNPVFVDFDGNGNFDAPGL